ncbi:PH domain-containing protein [Allokutzneria sp. A3M-2-11 16]|uniref:PH domain-containing protein n=1 Tax=Allokutzneria sp. A3M-2-11 16 TaxID=2962043 RepID=UPI0020B7849D|nr:PH domain-containing protein [Allokutzneria sp. A3M-2-11 16]MCP3798098.1 PH domain-containing protein [Allokutzneria sp. A3M-2-11 16]
MVFQLPRVALLPIALLTLCVTPVAFGAPGLQVIYLVPLALVWVVLRARTVAGSDGVVVRTALRSRRIEWSQVTSLQLGRPNKVSLVLNGGERLTLPAVRLGDLPALAKASGGVVPDPSATAEKTPEPGVASTDTDE